MSDTFVAWRGPSRFDGQPIMAIAVPKSTNGKTGKMINVHILRADMSPVDAMRTGADESICWTCPLRGELQPDGSRAGRGCYVVYGQGPQSAWRAHADEPAVHPDVLLDRFRDADVRLGAYGEPAALPLSIVANMLAPSRMWTCYTHRWRDFADTDAWRNISMASVDSIAEADEAEARGWRVYRYGHIHTRRPNEIVCPHETRGVQCIDCGLCDGASPRRRGVKSILATPHGTGAKYLKIVQ
jgi:hypothetical protein